MNKWLLAIIFVVILFILMELQNRKERPLYERLEKQNEELLRGRFKNPVLRRRFMRAMARYFYSENGLKLAAILFRSTMERASDPADKNACLLMYAYCLEDMEQYDEALTAYRQICFREPDFDLAQMRLARLLSKFESEESLDIFARLVEKSPEDAILRNNYGAALVRLEKYEEAIVQLRRTTELDPSLSAPYGLIALAYASMGENEQAEAAYEEAVSHGENAQQLRSILDEALENDAE